MVISACNGVNENADGVMEELLLSGDVDAVRRLLRNQSLNAKANDTSRSSPASAPSGGPQTASAASAEDLLFASRPLLRVSIGDINLQLRSVRTMGKVLWPAGHAVAMRIATRSKVANCPVVLIEIGAGAAVPSLIAAATGAFRAVVATDCFEEEVALIRHNAKLNGGKLAAVARLDVGENAMLTRVVLDHASSSASAHGEGAGPPLLVLACDMAYDPDAILALFASMRALADRLPARRPLLLFSRSSAFAHMDVQVRLHAARHGLALLGRYEQSGTAGILDSISESHLTPCVDDVVTNFFFAPSVERLSQGDAAAASDVRADLIDLSEEELLAVEKAAVIATAAGTAAPPPLARAVAAATALEADPTYRDHPAVAWLGMGAAEGNEERRATEQKPSEPAAAPAVPKSEHLGSAAGVQDDDVVDLWAPRAPHMQLRT